ncbi:uncharacterized protein LOC108092317 [Drosophila ficusphila]|uniref:uncharacterized protein LOC108092317 n=1 Tax=Drosophila ficusphila TaxID=30025 RepID=UPI0007E6CC1C|nr:uncharacterized protein LOC108092317 [Drosophila ficusphila]
MQGRCEHENIPNYGVANKKIFVMRKANSSIEVSETNKPTLNPTSEEKEVRQSDASLLQNSKSEEKVVREEIYTLPDLTKTNKKKNSIDNIIETDEESVLLNDQGSLSKRFSNKEAQVDIEKVSNNKSSELTEQDVNISSASGSLCLKTRVSSDPIDEELSSDSSSEFLNNEDKNINKKKKKEDLLKSENIKDDAEEDAEEKFRRNFLKTFQDLPRLSQISLDDDPKNTKNTKNAKPVKSASTSDIEIISIQSSNETVVSVQPVTPLIEEVENNLKNTEMDKLPSSKQHKSPPGSQDVLNTDKINGSPSSSTNKDI